METVKERLAYLRGEIEAERISYGEIAELRSLRRHIDPGDTLLLQWAGVPERELTDDEIIRLDEVHNTIHATIAKLAGVDPETLEWDIELIGSISDLIEDAVCEKWGLMTRCEFCPYVEVPV